MAPHNDSFPFKSSPFRFEPPGAWRTNDSSTALVYSNRSGARVSIPFFGSAVYLYSSLKADRYLLRILIDGVTLADVNLNGPSMAEPGPEIVVWNSPVLPGNHTFEAYNLGADPGRPYVALATLTVTSGEEQNHAPLVSSQPLPSNLGPVNNQSGLLPRVLAAFLSLVFFSTILVLFIRHKRKQNYDKMSRMMQDRQARHRPKKLSISHSLSPLYVPVKNLQLSYSSKATNSLSSYHYPQHLSLIVAHELVPLSIPQPATLPPHLVNKPAEQLSLLRPKTKVTPQTPPEDDEAQFWRSRPISDSVALQGDLTKENPA